MSLNLLLFKSTSDYGIFLLVLILNEKKVLPGLAHDNRQEDNKALLL